MLVRSPQERKGLLSLIIIWFGLVPIAIFFASHLFIPFMGRHHWSDIWTIQLTQINYHLNVAPYQKHGYSSLWWGWPLILRPIWYYFQSLNGEVRGILCIGNPLIFWSIPLVMGYMIWDVIRNRALASGLILWGFLCQWLFFAGVKRIKFFHYFDSAMPYVVLALAVIAIKLWRTGVWGRAAVTAYIALVVGMFFYWYPLLTGFPISQAYFQQHMWFKSWI